MDIGKTRTAEETMLRNINSEQLNLVLAWLKEKETAYQAQPLAVDSLVMQLFDDLTQAIASAEYAPTETHMTEAIDQIAASLERRDAKKAALKLRIAGNKISRQMLS